MKALYCTCAGGKYLIVLSPSQDASEELKLKAAAQEKTIQENEKVVTKLKEDLQVASSKDASTLEENKVSSFSFLIFLSPGQTRIRVDERWEATLPEPSCPGKTRTRVICELCELKNENFYVMVKWEQNLHKSWWELKSESWIFLHYSWLKFQHVYDPHSRLRPIHFPLSKRYTISW